jgi:hypothetical protein
LDSNASEGGLVKVQSLTSCTSILSSLSEKSDIYDGKC